MGKVKEHALVQHYVDVAFDEEHWSYWTCRCGFEYGNESGWFTREHAREVHRFHLMEVARQNREQLYGP